MDNHGARTLMRSLGVGIGAACIAILPLAGLPAVNVSEATHLPVRVLGYEGSVLVRSVDFSDVKLVR